MWVDLRGPNRSPFLKNFSGLAVACGLWVQEIKYYPEEGKNADMIDNWMCIYTHADRYNGLAYMPQS